MPEEASFPGLPPGAEMTDPSGVPMAPDPTGRQSRGPAGPRPSRRRAPVLIPTQPTPSFPASPFAPQAQPFPPVPPGAPVAPGAPPPGRGDAGQPAAAPVAGCAYGRVVGPLEGGRDVGKAPPGCGITGPTGRPTTRGCPGRNTHSL